MTARAASNPSVQPIAHSTEQHHDANMYGQPTGIDTNIIWWALIIGLLVQSAMIYGCIRLALMHHHVWVQVQSVKAERAAKRTTKRSAFLD